MCWRSEYELYARTSSKPASSKPARSLMEVLRELLPLRRPQMEQAQVVLSGPDSRPGPRRRSITKAPRRPDPRAGTEPACGGEGA
jgi:hypothetical protein